MYTVREIKERTETFFSQKNVPNAKLDTDILIAHSLSMKRLDLYLDMERPLTEQQLDVLRPLVKRRATREPIQYIIGSTDFYGLTLKVDSRALIPRQETEELVDRIVARLSEAPKRILDLGTGSGAIAFALASKYPEACITAIDSSTGAIALALENATAQDLADRVRIIEGNWWSPIADDESFDLIVSNPPYLTEAEMQSAEPEVVDYEPQEALVAGYDGLNDLRILLEGAPKYLCATGLLAMETGIAQSESLTAMATIAGLTCECIEDLNERPRFFFATPSHA
jgi:release factor glutamine methyltransferase